MPAYGDIDQAIPGLIAEGIQNVSSIRSRAAKQDIQFGKSVMGYLGDAVSAYNYALDTAKVVFDSDFASPDAVTFTVNGVSTASVVFATSHANTMDLLITALRGLTVVDSVLGNISVDAALDPADGTNRTIYIRTTGVDNTTSMADDAGTPPAETITYQTDQVFIGVAVYSSKNVTTSNVAKYFVDEAVNVMEKGLIYGYINGTPAADDDAFLDNAGSDKGNFAS